MSFACPPIFLEGVLSLNAFNAKTSASKDLVDPPLAERTHNSKLKTVVKKGGEDEEKLKYL